MNLHKPNNKWLLHSWSTFGARISCMQTHIHKTHHGLDLVKATTFPLIVLSMPGHEASIQMSFCPRTPKLGVPKFLKLELPWLLRPITFCAKFKLRWDLKKSCSPRQRLSNDMWYNTYTQVNQGNSELLVVGSQIDNLTPNLFFGHNLCF
jgi:hypothetical protein